MSISTGYKRRDPMRAFMTRLRLKPVMRRLQARFVELQEAPRKVALGFALGILVGMTPFWGVHIPTCLLVAVALRWSKVAALIGVQITNVLTAPFIYPLNYWIGVNLVGISGHVTWPRELAYDQLLDLVVESPLILIDLCIGGVIIGLPLAVCGYVVVCLWIRTIQG